MNKRNKFSGKRLFQKVGGIALNITLLIVFLIFVAISEVYEILSFVIGFVIIITAITFASPFIFFFKAKTG